VIKIVPVALERPACSRDKVDQRRVMISRHDQRRAAQGINPDASGRELIMPATLCHVTANDDNIRLQVSNSRCRRIHRARVFGAKMQIGQLDNPHQLDLARSTLAA
jgi:hypothetical protein